MYLQISVLLLRIFSRSFKPVTLLSIISTIFIPSMRKWLLIFFVLFTNTSLIAEAQSSSHWETAIFSTNNWRYRPGISEPGTDWRTLNFDDSSWAEGPGGFGFGDNDDNTILSPCRSVFLRIKFNITDTSSIGSCILNIDYDDGFVAYLNDSEIARDGIQGAHPPADQFAEDHEAMMYRGGMPESFLINKNELHSIINNGDNILAVQVHNSSGTSSDLSSNIWLSFEIKGESHFFSQVPDWFTPLSGFESSELPIVVITTSPGEDIQDEPKITADMKVIHNGNGQTNHVSDSGNIYTGKVGIEIRGYYSSSLPQKPYGFETRDDTGSNLNIPLLGMPEENDWILTANYNDKTFLRNFLAFELFRKMGHYAPRTRYCEVVLNGEYQGIYLLGEKIKQDKNRVDIAKLNPDENSGDDLTGGYIFANDYYHEDDSWLSNFSPLNKRGADVYFVYYDPEPEDLTSVQKTYLKDFVDSFESVLYSPGFKDTQQGYKAYLDVSSFVDYFILGELTRNVDAYKKSRFLYKDKGSKGGKISSGPPWDYDWAWKDIVDDCIHFNQTDGSGWAYRVNDCVDWPVPPSWEIRLLQDDDFANKINQRYFSMRETILGETYLNHVIDSVAGLLNEAQVRHFEKWPILGINVGTPEYGDQPETFSGEIEKFKAWINRRLAWLDSNMVGDTASGNNDNPALFRIFPNPVTDFLHIESDVIINRVSIFSIPGNPVLEQTDCSDYTTSIDVSHLKPGLFIVKVYFKSGEVVSQKIIKK